MSEILQTDPMLEQAKTAAKRLHKVRAEIAKVVIGQTEVVDLSLITLLAGGHGLLVGLPGLAKTLLVETLATVTGLSEKRIQFTPDLMPADILGSEVLETETSGKRAFRFIKGPVFCQLLMADEINRASPRTQSALLQAMQEHEVTIAGKPRKLPTPFHVLATQNPIEQEGTYPLPEAQLDRFLLQIDINYPDEVAERDILIATTGTKMHRAKPCLDAKTLVELQQLVRAMPVGKTVLDAILQLVRTARPAETSNKRVRDHVVWGPGPRAGQALMLGCRARALLRGNFAPDLDDVIALAPAALKHRMALGFSARAEGENIETLIAHLLQEIV
ncbi:FIG017823: ATPase, MoxR family [hydrothermal vent metagenome]|uniref:FIG017823: ATPase, MoxR family n=1 Tax=hydrothermal vent metagenome TaxID=652676 RepID=A0A3B0SBL1_9ZZZZ